MNEKRIDNQSILNNTDRLIRYYQIPVHLKKEEVLNTILSKIREQEKTVQKSTRKISMTLWIGVAAAASIAIIVTIYILTESVTFSGKNGESLAFRLPDES